MDITRGNGQKVLIVDDDQNHVQLLKKRLEANGYQTIIANDGVDGLNQAVHQRPDLIITDVLLPRMNGFQMVENLKSGPETSSIPVIMMSAVYVTDEDMARGFELGAETYVSKADLALRKPLQEEMLLEAAAALTRREKDSPDRAAPRVLIVDDDADITRLIDKRLQPEGYQLDVAHDGEAALEKVLSEPVDLVLLDVQLPGMDGLEVLSRIKERHPEVGVVMMTAYGSEKVAVEALKRGADDYLIKPLDDDEPVPSVRQNLEKLQRRREVKKAAGKLREASVPESEEKERLIDELRQSSIELMDQYNRLLSAEEQNRAYAERLEQMVDERTEDLRRRSQQLATMHSVLTAATRSLELSEVMIITLGELDQLMEGQAAAAFLVDNNTGRLRLVAQHDLPEEFLRQVLRTPGGEGVFARVLKTGVGENIPDRDEEDALRGISGHGAAVVFPMRSPGGIVGLILEVCEVPRDIDESGWKLLDAIGEELGVVVENTRLYESLRQSYLATIRSLAEAVDAKDSYTRGHSDKVSAYAVAIARQLGMDNKSVNMIRDAGFLHDIGKIGTPDAVLLKRGFLDEQEMHQMQMHPGDSCKIITKAHLPQEINLTIRHHHERYDGTGYPDALAGEAIPLGSRILAVADAYEAMTSDRPYRDGLAAEGAVSEIQRCVSTQFDPVIVEAFLKIRESVDEQLRAQALAADDPEGDADDGAAVVEPDCQN